MSSATTSSRSARTSILDIISLSAVLIVTSLLSCSGLHGKSREILIYCSGMTHHVARYEPEDRVVNFAILGNRQFTSAALRLDTIVPGSTKGQALVCNMSNKMASFFGSRGLICDPVAP